MGKRINLAWTIKGGFVTDFCRHRFIETESVQEGIRALQVMCPGIPANIAEMVVRGSKKVVGTHDMYIENDDKVIEPIKPIDIADCLCGWIAPDGRVFGHVGYNETDDHESLSEAIMRRKEITYIGSSYASVEAAGYVKFSPDKALTYALASRVTDLQRLAVIRFAESHGFQQFQLGPSACGILSLMEMKQLDLLQFGFMISIHP